MKLNGRLLRRSPLSDLLELGAVAGITGKQALWVSLRDISVRQPRGSISLLNGQRNRNVL